MSFFQNMDLYKGVILGSVVLLPAAGWWIKTTQDGIDEANRAVIAATRSGGYIEEIGRLEQQLRTVDRNSRAMSVGTGNPDLYFDRQIIISATGNRIDKNQFKINPPREDPAMTGKQPVTDHIVKIDWLPRGGKDYAFSMEFLFAVLFNCETGWTGSATQDLPSIWKLYSLKIDNEELQKLAVQQMAPPPQVADQWIVSKMEFARREPRKDRR
ncbi:MAG: hypothetical protein AB7O97_15055 [Planctomycetota bacterium]